MARTQTSICNLALARVGSNPTTNVTTDAAAGVKGPVECLAAWDEVVAEVARSARWNCIKERAVLTVDGTAPAFGWTYRYPLPADYARIVQWNGTDIINDGASEFFEIEGAWLLTDSTEANIQYTSINAAYTVWDSLFVDCIVVLLASKIAVRLRNDDGLRQALQTEYERTTLPKARAKNGAERRKQLPDAAETGTSQFVQARRFSTRG